MTCPCSRSRSYWLRLLGSLFCLVADCCSLPSARAQNLEKPLQSIDEKATDTICLPGNLAGRICFKPNDQGFEQRLGEIRKVKSRTAPGS